MLQSDAVANAAKGILKDNGAIATMTYFGGEKCVPGYNVMGICKAPLKQQSDTSHTTLAPEGFE